MAYSFTDLLRRFPSLTGLSRELGLSYNTVQAWTRRDTVPGHYWADIATAALKLGVAGVTVTALGAAAGEQREQRKAKRQIVNAAAAAARLRNAKRAKRSKAAGSRSERAQAS
jgi:hypothetical protein